MAIIVPSATVVIGDVYKPFGQLGQACELGFHNLHRLLGYLYAGLVGGGDSLHNGMRTFPGHAGRILEHGINGIE